MRTRADALPKAASKPKLEKVKKIYTAAIPGSTNGETYSMMEIRGETIFVSNGPRAKISNNDLQDLYSLQLREIVDSATVIDQTQLSIPKDAPMCVRASKDTTLWDGIVRGLNYKEGTNNFLNGKFLSKNAQQKASTNQMSSNREQISLKSKNSPNMNQHNKELGVKLQISHKNAQHWHQQIKNAQA